MPGPAWPRPEEAADAARAPRLQWLRVRRLARDWRRIERDPPGSSRSSRHTTSPRPQRRSRAVPALVAQVQKLVHGALMESENTAGDPADCPFRWLGFDAALSLKFKQMARVQLRCHKTY